MLLPKETLQNLSVLTAKIIEICKKEKIVNKLIRSDEVSKHIRSNFTHCWSYFYDFIVIFTSRWKNQLGDLEVFSVGMVITLHSIVSKTFERNGLNFSNWQKNKVNIDEGKKEHSVTVSIDENGKEDEKSGEKTENGNSNEQQRSHGYHGNRNKELQ